MSPQESSRLTPTPAPVTPVDTMPRRRQRALRALMLVVLAVAFGVGIWWWTIARWEVHTENAYVGGNVVTVSAQQAGTVVAVEADDTRKVDAGQILVRLDATDHEVQLAGAEAALADAVRSVSGLYANRAQARAQVGGREAELARARAELAAAESAVDRTRSELDRREELVKRNFISAESLQTARSAARSALAQRDAARAVVLSTESAITAAAEQYQAARVLVDRVDVAAHPRVQAAAARVRELFVARSRVEIPAPVSGYVARRSVQVGQRIAAGTALLSIIPPEQMWVDANFKEAELERVRIGQEVELHADLYGKSVTYHGKVVGLGMGTGSAFSLLPAQNATGNWIKIVQRVPVRVALLPEELARHPLRIGLSMDARINVRDASGPALAELPAREPALRTDVFEVSLREADARVATIIARHRGQTAP